jgi:hypothetical protein
MDHPTIARITTKNQALLRYHLRVEMPPTVVAEADLDLAEGRQVWYIGLLGQPFPMSTVYWNAGESLAHVGGGRGWMTVRGSPLGHELGRLATWFRDERPEHIEELDDVWILTYRLERLPFAPAVVQHFETLARDGTSDHLRETTRRVADAANGLQATIRLRVSRRSELIEKIDLEYRWEQGGAPVHRHASVEISPGTEPVPQAPAEASQLVRGEISPGMLFFSYPGTGGWSNASHGPWAQRAIDQVMASEAARPELDRQYAELYHPGWSSQAYTEAEARAGIQGTLGVHHPVVVGALNEDAEGTLKATYDAWFANDAAFQTNSSFYYGAGDYKRSFHHFGGDSTGLKDRWYFWFHGPPNTTVGDRFYSARDWGYGHGRINEDLNRLTFTRAIEQYHGYTKDGKRRAYLMMGHVLHLLQDQGEPDHAALVDHAGSSMDEVQAYGTYHYCEILAAEAALVAAAACGPFWWVCGPAAFAVTEGACWASASKRVMGFEKLIAQEWDITGIEQAIAARGVVAADYDAAFHDLAGYALQQAQSRGLSYALGCSTLALVPPIPNADPAIDADDAGETRPYLELTNALVPDVIARTAGLLEHFFDVANYPPFLEHVMVVQFEPRQRPVRFGVLREPADRHCTRYEARWQTTAAGRALIVDQSQPLALDTPAYVFLMFGPSRVFPERSKRMRNPTLTVKGNQPGHGPLDIPVNLTEAIDPQLGPYYWGTFEATNCASDPYQLTLHVSGDDAGPHAGGRNPTGASLDADPSTRAHVDISQSDLRWADYAPGEDTHHRLWVPVPVWHLEITPPGPFALRTDQRVDTRVLTLGVTQTSWDCHWEPYPGRATCPTIWQLDPTIQRTVRLRTTSGPWTDFGLQIALEDGPRGSTKLLRVTATSESMIGRYEMEVRCTYGMFHDWLRVEFDVVG